MTRRHFHQISFEDGKLYPQLPLNHPEYHKQRNLISEVMGTLNRYTSLWWLFDTAFREAKVFIKDPEIRELIIYLKDNPDSEPKLWLKGDVRAIMVDVGYDTSKLADIQTDNKLLGELFIGWIEEALSKLSAYPQIPCDLIRTVMTAWREDDYTYRYEIGERTIPGTKLKGRLARTLNCVEPVSTLTLLYRGKALFHKETYHLADISRRTYKHFAKLSLEGAVLRVHNPRPHATDTLIDLAEYPEVMEILNKTK